MAPPNKNNKRGVALTTFFLGFFFSQSSVAIVTFDGDDGVFKQIFEPVCIDCHTSDFADGHVDRESAANEVNFNTWTQTQIIPTIYAGSAAGRNSTRAAAITVDPNPSVDAIFPDNAYMPYPYATGFVGTKSSGQVGTKSPYSQLSAAHRSLLQTWVNQTEGATDNAAPTVVTDAAVITQTSITLNSSIEQNGLTTTTWFKHAPIGTALSGTSTINSTSIGNGGGIAVIPHSANITSLNCETDYHYRAFASNTDGTTQGALTNYKTSNCTDPDITTNGGGMITEAGSTNNSPNAFTNVNLAATPSPGSTGLTWSISTDNNGGTATFVGSGTKTDTGNSVVVNYLPGTDFSGPDDYTITVTDNTPTSTPARTDTIQIRFNVGIVAPTISGSTTITLDEDGSPIPFTLGLFTTPLSANDTDTDNTLLTWDLATAASTGTAAVSGTGTTPTITYTPAANLNGTAQATFTIRASDPQGNNDTHTVTVNLTAQNDAPGAVNDSYTVTVTSTNNILTPLSNDTDVDLNNSLNNPVTETQEIISVTTPSNGGTVSITAAGVGNTITYSPVGNSQVVETFNYTMSDSNGVQSTATITINFQDTDSDGFADFFDNCPLVSNNNQLDTDSDGPGDVCDNDPTNDGILDTFIEFTVTQNSQNGSIVFSNDGNITIVADLNSTVGTTAVTHDWSMTDGTVLATQISLTTNTFVFDPSTLALGLHTIDVSITDSGVTTHNTHVINILAATEPTLTAIDTDGDGTNDDIEGYKDSDSDGVPDFRDDSTINGNMMQTQSASRANTLYLRSAASTKLYVGSTANAAGIFGTLLQSSDITNFGGTNGTATTMNVDNNFTLNNDIFDFEISNITQIGGSEKIVLPLSSNLRPGSVYRKFNSSTGWQTYTIDSNNSIASANSAAGLCPAPGDSAYINGLNAFHNCIQLTIQDGGPNDADGEINGIIRDPGGIAISTSDFNNNVGDASCDTSLLNNCAETRGTTGSSNIFWLMIFAHIFLLRSRQYKINIQK
jgi:Bacterial Ig domain